MLARGQAADVLAAVGEEAQEAVSSSSNAWTSLATMT